MKLLILTQVVDQDDPNLGFFHRWIEEFAKHCEEVHVVCLRKGKYSLPANVHVSSLGKEEGGGRLMYLWRFYRLIWSKRKAYDSVFVHMNSEYLVLGGFLWKIFVKRVGLWHTHKSISMIARLGAPFADIIMTASPESYRRKTSKLRVLGHGIDTEWAFPSSRRNDGLFRIISVGRLSRIKDYGTLLRVVERLKKEGKPLEVLLVGGPLTRDDTRYHDELVREVGERGLSDTVHFVGSVSHRKILPYVREADVFVNCSGTGSLDKAVLEAMAAGIPVITSNDGLKSTLGVYAEQLMFRRGNADELFQKLNDIQTMSPEKRKALGESLRHIVIAEHSLSRLIPKILGLLRV